MKISKNIIKKFSDYLDDIIKAGGVLEIADGFAINLALNFVNNKWGDNIPDVLTPQLETLLTAIIDGDYPLAKQKAASILAGLINTPFINDTQEEVDAYKAFIGTIEKLITSLLNKKQAA